MQTPLGIFILIVVAITAGASIFVSSQADAYPNDYVAPVSSAEYEHAIVAIGGTIVTAEIVDTKEKLELGLSGREGLSFNKGMLFVFPKTGYHSFWMKDMSFPIDIIWLSKEKLL